MLGAMGLKIMTFDVIENHDFQRRKLRLHGYKKVLAALCWGWCDWTSWFHFQTGKQRLQGSKKKFAALCWGRCDPQFSEQRLVLRIKKLLIGKYINVYGLFSRNSSKYAIINTEDANVDSKNMQNASFCNKNCMFRPKYTFLLYNNGFFEQDSSFELKICALRSAEWCVCY